MWIKMASLTKIWENTYQQYHALLCTVYRQQVTIVSLYISNIDAYVYDD